MKRLAKLSNSKFACPNLLVFCGPLTLRRFLDQSNSSALGVQTNMLSNEIDLLCQSYHYWLNITILHVFVFCLTASSIFTSKPCRLKQGNMTGCILTPVSFIELCKSMKQLIRRNQCLLPLVTFSAQRRQICFEDHVNQLARSLGQIIIIWKKHAFFRLYQT